MAELPPFHNEGVATFTDASATVTFTDGLLLSSGAGQYDRIVNAAGETFTIEKIDDDNTLTLTRPFTGTAQTDGVYEIWPTPMAVELQGKARNALNRVAAPAIAAIAEIVDPALLKALGGLDGSGGNKMIRLTAAGEADVVTAANVFALAGLTLAANKGLHATGAGGLATHDLTEFMRGLFASANGSAVYTGLGQVPNAQIRNDLTADKAFRRGNIIGAVSQTGGVPAGELMEYGSNSNGEYVRFANGLQICWGAVTLGFLTTVLLNATWTFPAAFSAESRCLATIDMTSSVGYAPSSAQRGQWGATTTWTGTGLTNFGVQVARITGAPDFVSGNTVIARVAAFGRWF